jgi:2-oxoglutarate ferredoxin oxidoreductase subunit alpha
MKKFTAIGCIIPPPKIFGEKDADITFVSWGTNKGPILEAMKLLSVKRISSQYIHYSWLFPFPAESSIPLLAKAKRVIDVEQNATAQLLGLIRQYTGYEIKETVLKFDGRPFDPEEIIERIHI